MKRTCHWMLAVLTLALPCRTGWADDSPAGQWANDTPADGWVVWASNREDGHHEIYRMKARAPKDAADREVTRLTDTEFGARIALWSPDGAWIAYHEITLPGSSASENLGDVHVMRWDGSEDKILMRDATPAFWMRPNPNVAQGLMCRKGDTFYLVDPDTGESTEEFSKTDFRALDPKQNDPDVSADNLRFSPSGITHDGRYLVAFTKRYRNGYDGTNGPFNSHNSAAVFDLQAKEKIFFVGPGCEPTTPPDGPYLYHVNGLNPTDPDTHPDIYRVKLAELVGNTDPDKSRQSYQPEMAHPDNEWGHEYFPHISNDGKWLVYGATTDGTHDHQEEDYELFIHRLGSGNDSRTPLTYHGGNDQFPDLYVGKLGSAEDPKPRPSVELKINSGGNTSVAGWESDAAYRTDGEAYTFTGVDVDLNGQSDPAPTEVYKTCIHLDHRYSFPVPDGTYRVRLHFFDKGGSDRRMDYEIEGVKRLEDFNITNGAGGPQKALIKEFEVEVSDGDGMQVVALKDQGNDVFESAIEIRSVAEEPIAVDDPSAVQQSGGANSDTAGADNGVGAGNAQGTGEASALAALDDGGRLIGTGCTLAGDRAVTVIPWLLLCGLLALRRRRRPRASSASAATRQTGC